MRKALFFGMAAVIGAAVAYLFDPDRGRSRRAKLTDQAGARARDASESVRAKTEYQRGVAKGLLHEATGSMRGEKVYDDATLLQKVRSEALGYWPDSQSIEIDITDGMVRVTGTVGNKTERERLVELIRDVDGVGLIDDRLRIEA
jgi:osmotically-inducible protein OsmY